MDFCFCYTFFLYSTGRAEDAIDVALRGVGSDPLNSMAQNMYGRALYAARRYQEAVPPLVKAVALNRDSLSARQYLARAYEALENYNEAFNVLDRPAFQPSGALALAYARAGRHDEARSMLKRLTDDYRGLIGGSHPGGHRYEAAVAYFALGDKNAGLRELASVLKARLGGVAFARFDPALDAIQSDPDFKNSWRS